MNERHEQAECMLEGCMQHECVQDGITLHAMGETWMR